MRRKKAGQTQMGQALSSLSGRFRFRSSESYSENRKRQKEFAKSEKTLKYGGSGILRKIAYSGTSSIIGENATSKLFTGIFGNRQQQENAYRTVIGNSGNNGQTQSLVNGMKIIRVRLTDIENSMSETSDKLDHVLSLSESIYENTLTKNQKRTRRKGAELRPIQKSTFLGQEITQPSLQRLDSKSSTLEAIYEELMNLKLGSYDRPSKTLPATYEGFLKKTKDESKAERAMKVGGYGIGRRMMFGLTKSVVGENAASWLAHLGRNKKDMQKAYKTLNADNIQGTQSGDSPIKAIQEMQSILGELKPKVTEVHTELTGKKGEKLQEWRDDVTKRLKRIERKIESSSGSALSKMGTLGAALATLTGLVRRGGRGGRRGREGGRGRGGPTGGTPRPGSRIPSGVGRVGRVLGPIGVGLDIGSGVYDLSQGHRQTEMEGWDFLSPMRYGMFAGEQINQGVESLTGERLDELIGRGLSDIVRESLTLPDTTQQDAEMLNYIKDLIISEQPVPEEALKWAESKGYDLGYIPPESSPLSDSENFANRLGPQGSSLNSSTTDEQLPSFMREGPFVYDPNSNFDSNEQYKIWERKQEDWKRARENDSQIPRLDNPQSSASSPIIINQAAPNIVAGNNGGNVPSIVFVRDPNDPAVAHDQWLREPARIA